MDTTLSSGNGLTGVDISFSAAIPPATPRDQLKFLLEDTRVTDICMNRHDDIYVDRGVGLEPQKFSSPLFASEAEYRTFVLENISLSGKTWDAKLPFLDTIFFQTHRAHIAFPPLAQFGIYLSLRRLPQKNLNLADDQKIAELRAAGEQRWSFPVAAAVTQPSAFGILTRAIEAHETILIAGGTGSGKTTLLNDLLAFADRHERIVALEDTAEISPAHSHYLSLLSRTANADGFGTVTLRDLLRQTLRMRPDRVLIGECRGDEVLDLLQALNTGHRGTLCTIHANSARDALRRVELLALLGAKGTIPSPLIKELIAFGIQKLVFLERVNGRREIQMILQIEGKEKDIIFTRPIFSSLTETRVPATVS
jgi:pilus assembly protein CpaF